MSLTVKELESLLNLVNPEIANNQTFETIANTFHSVFTKTSSFKICNALVLFLEKSLDVLPTATQRLAALFLIFECYRNDDFINNPFASVFLKLLESKNDKSNKPKNLNFDVLSQKEFQFIAHLILNSIPIKDLIKLTPKQALTMDETVANFNDLNLLLEKIKEKESKLPITCKSAISVFIDNPNKKNENNDSERVLKKKLVENLLKVEPSVAELFYIPSPIRISPIMDFPDHDFFWAYPSELDDLDLIWDDTMNTNIINIENDNEKSLTAEISQLMNKAFLNPLTLKQQERLLSCINNDLVMVNNSGLTPEKLPDLVEKNPMAAIEILLTLIKSDEISEYMSVLVNMDLSVHSMEVINRLTSAVEFPPDLIIHYINNCMTSCEQNKDKSMQNRMVRLVCVFLESLIRNKIINLKLIQLEVQSFCIEFSRIREASALFRLIKDLERNETENDQNVN